MLPQRNQAIHNERQIRIICIGAGASGLLFAYKLQRSFRNMSLTVSQSIDLSYSNTSNSDPADLDLRKKCRGFRNLVGE